MGPWAHVKHCPLGESAAWNSTRGPIRSRGTHGSQMGGTGVSGLFWILQGRPGFDSSFAVLEKDRKPKKMDVSMGGWKGPRGCYDSGVVQRGVDVAKNPLQGALGPPPLRENRASHITTKAQS